MREVDLRDDLAGKSQEETRIHLKDFYDNAYKSGQYKPLNAYGAWMRLFKLFKPFREKKHPFKKALEVGCGTGIGVSFANMMGHDAWGIDLADASKYWKLFDIQDKCLMASALNIPFKDDEFDFILVPDVMEHIPEEDVLDTLKEIRRVGSKLFFYIIHVTKENAPLKVLHNGEELRFFTHITQKPPAWWGRKMSDAEYGSMDFTITEQHVVFVCTKKADQAKEWR